ncbi:MAG TPA: transcription elongation factor GreA [Polyangiales bacterium]|nr:transcription elongation factor GreA [Polyangiales bacterium]
MERVPMTPEGHTALQIELKHLKGERPKISEEIGTAALHGDLKENAEYHAAREKQSHVEGRIMDIEDQLARAEVIDTTGFSGDKVKFGAYVTLVELETDKEISYRIVGPGEASTDKGTISVTSPVAKAIVGRVVGDEVQVHAPGGVKRYEIQEVRWSP